MRRLESTATGRRGSVLARFQAIDQSEASSAFDRVPDSEEATAVEYRGAVLWIDDEVRLADSAVRLLGLDGFQVDCAESGAAGLAKARGGQHKAVILDLRLPDMNGLAVLATLRAEGFSAPVLVLTAWGDLPSRRVANGLGVVDFLDKPLYVDDLLGAVRAAVSAGAVWGKPPPGISGSPAGQPESELELLNHLLDDLSTFAHLNTKGGRHGNRIDGSVVTPVDTRNTLVKLLVRALVHPALGIRTFLACAKALQQVLSVQTDPAVVAANRARDSVAVAARPSATSFGPKVQAAIARIESSVANHSRLREGDCAKALAIHPAHLGRLLRRETGLGFREWWTATAIQTAVRRLVNTSDQVKHISYDLGFADPSELDRAFRCMFGVTPLRFRQLWRIATEATQ